MLLRIACAALVASCGRDDGAPPRLPPETLIARDLTARLGMPVTVRCIAFGVRCQVTLGDGSESPIWVTSAGSAWEWRSAGLAIDTAPITAYIDGVLADLGIAQTARCAPRIAHARRLACGLSGGGAAFVSIARDGQLALELALDPHAAAARSGPADDRELVRASHALEHLDGEADEP